jgi:hypothetical protein
MDVNLLLFLVRKNLHRKVEVELYYLLQCDVMYSVGRVSTFLRGLLSASSG